MRRLLYYVSLCNLITPGDNLYDYGDFDRREVRGQRTTSKP